MKKLKKRIPKFVIKNYFKEDYVKSDWALDISLSYLPIIRLLLIFSNISYLCGNYEGGNEIYKALEDVVSKSDDLIRILEKNKYISADKEKQQRINDINNALKILEKKYDDNSENNEENVIEIYENDDLEQLKLKRKMLDEMIELKKSQKKDANNKPDTLSLKYKPDKKKKK